MKVVCKNPGTVSLFSPSYMEKPVVFKNGVASVSDEVGAKMIKEYTNVVAMKAPKHKTQKGVNEDG